MARLKLWLLGSPLIERDGSPVEVDTHKAIALLAYLAMTGQTHRRETLATLLWSEYEPERAYANLRRTLWSLNKAIGKIWLEVDQDTVGLSGQTGFWLDVMAFRAHLADCQRHDHPEAGVCPTCLSSLSAAVALYRADFMTGFSLRDSPNFDDWQFFQAESLRRELGGALSRLVCDHTVLGEFEPAITYARRWLALDPLEELVHRRLMQLYDWTGQRAAALRQYQECVSILRDEFDLTPEPETTALYEAIREKRAAPSTETSPALEISPFKPSLPEVEPRAAPEDSPPRQIPLSPAQRHRHLMLKAVRTFWIQGVLENSLHGVVRLELGLSQVAEAVDHPWDTLLCRPGSPAQRLPAGTKLLTVFDRLNGKLLILGGPGSGKTTTLLELARDLLDRAERDETQPIPVIFNLSSWLAPQPLVEWLVEELGGKYQVPPQLAKNWVENEALLLLLDGLDEVATDQRQACVRVINSFRQAFGFVDMVVCSRLADYQPLRHKLKLNGAVMLQPLTEAQIETYLAGLGPGAAPVQTLLAADQSLRHLCQSPLLLSILVLAYHDLSPREILQLGTLADRRQHLFQVYIDRMFGRRLGEGPYTPTQTKRYLSWLAQHMLDNGLTVFHLTDLQPMWLKFGRQRQHYRLGLGLVSGWLDGLLVGTAVGLPVALLAGLTAGIEVGLATVAIWGLVSLLAAGLRIELVAGRWQVLTVALASTLFMAVFGQPLAALIIGVLVGLVAGLQLEADLDLSQTTPASMVQPQLPTETISVNTLSHQSLRQTVQTTVGRSLVSGLPVGLLIGLIAGPGSGLMTGLVVGLIAASTSPRSRALVQHYMLRLVLVHHQTIPKNYRRLLDYAVRLIFMHQVGEGYIFIHRYLLEYFAGLEPD